MSLGAREAGCKRNPGPQELGVRPISGPKRFLGSNIRSKGFPGHSRQYLGAQTVSTGIPDSNPELFLRPDLNVLSPT